MVELLVVILVAEFPAQHSKLAAASVGIGGPLVMNFLHPMAALSMGIATAVAGIADYGMPIQS